MKDPQRLTGRRVVWEHPESGLVFGVVSNVVMGEGVIKLLVREGPWSGCILRAPINQVRQFQEPPRTHEWFESLSMLDEVE